MARLEQLLEQIRKDKDVRRNLIEIRQNISDESLRRRFVSILGGDYTLLTELLRHEDPKVRKNAALILGETGDETVLPLLFEAWKTEETLYVREDYLKAVSGMDYREYLPQMEERIRELSEKIGQSPAKPREEAPNAASEEASNAASEEASNATSEEASNAASEEASSEGNPLWDNDRHLLSELSVLRLMTAHFEEHERHHFTKMNPAPELILRTNVLHADVTAKQIQSGTVHAMRGAVHVKGGNLHEILKIRTWIECLLPIPGAKPIQGDEKMIAAKLRDLKIGNYLNYLHADTGSPYRYRIELKSSSVPGEKRGEYIRRIASRLDLLEKGRLLNSDSDYEVELRLIERRDHSMIPMLRLFTLPDQRFSYRKETTAQSTSAPLAALAVALAAPYLREGAQILDPFCGVGTLLMERCFAVSADPVYGVDRFAEAIEKARRNCAEAAGKENDAPAGAEARLRIPVHYINRDFFDFTHDYLFDEIITHLPGVEPGEGKAFAEHFLRKADDVLRKEAVLVVLTDTPEDLKEAAGESGKYQVLEEYLLNERSGCTELILQKH